MTTKLEKLEAAYWDAAEANRVAARAAAKVAAGADDAAWAAALTDANTTQNTTQAAYAAYLIEKDKGLLLEIFEELFPDKAQLIKGFWMPNSSWENCNVTDPSARALPNYGESGK